MSDPHSEHSHSGLDPWGVGPHVLSGGPVRAVVSRVTGASQRLAHVGICRCTLFGRLETSRSMSRPYQRPKSAASQISCVSNETACCPLSPDGRWKRPRILPANAYGQTPKHGSPGCGPGTLPSHTRQPHALGTPLSHRPQPRVPATRTRNGRAAPNSAASGRLRGHRSRPAASSLRILVAIAATSL